MALQTCNLVMVGLGVLKDRPPNRIQPPLANGIHMRWSFKRELGFPWYGYYLFRRRHMPGRLTSSHLRPMPGVEVDGRRYRQFEFDEPVRRIEIRLEFRARAEIEVVALLWGTPVAQTVARGSAGDRVRVDLAFDAMTAMRVELGPVGVADFRCVSVSQDATVGWEPVPDFPYPMTLPVIQAEYPCTLGVAENLASARSMAVERIRYGGPDEFTAISAPIYGAGTVSVENGSSIVTGTDTEWSDELVGRAFQVTGDPTAYTVVKVVDHEKLVLSRGYIGASRAELGYEIRDDAFVQFHDQLIHLVAGGSATGSMADRSVQHVVYNAGTIMTGNGLNYVYGVMTDWTKELVGLDLQVIGATTGTVTVRNGERIVSGTRTIWNDDLVGMAFQVAGDHKRYTILAVRLSTELQLDRGYEGSEGIDKAYTIYEKTLYTILDVNADAIPPRLVLSRPYLGSTSMSKSYAIISALQPSQENTPRMPLQYPLDLVLLGTLHPSVAQMAGLYWVDQKTEPNAAYDYLIVADHEGHFGCERDPRRVLEWLRYRLDEVDGYIVFNKKKAPAPSLSPPADPRVYALPADWGAAETPNNSGLTWDLGVSVGALLPDKAVMYHLWRADLEDVENEDIGPTTAPPVRTYTLITRKEPDQEQPILVSPTPDNLVPERPPDWPPFLMHVIDRGLADGWYSYRVSGIDIFGRHSPLSAPAQWFQWEPMPDPRPWYYRDSGGPVINDYAVRLLDKAPPPPPTGIEAFVLDPADPTVLQDEVYNGWREVNGDVVGLRLRWQWTWAHMQQAPDLREFRIYYQPGRLNASLGQVVTVSPISLEASVVEIEIDDAHPADAYVGAWLRVGASAFKIVGVESARPLRLRVKNTGPHHRVGTVSVEDGSKVVTGTNTSWREKLAGMILHVDGDLLEEVYTITKVNSPTHLTLASNYTGAPADEREYAIHKIPRANSPCTLVMPFPYTAGKVSVSHGEITVDGTGKGWQAELVGHAFRIIGESKEYQIVSVNTASQQLTLDEPYAGTTGSGKAYTILHPLFKDYSEALNWSERIYVVGRDEHVLDTIPAGTASNGELLRGKSATVVDNVVTLHTNLDLSDLNLEKFCLWLERDTVRANKTYRILAIEAVREDRREVTVDESPRFSGVGPSRWVIGLPVPLRQYEVFLPAPHTGTDDSFGPSLADPIVYAHIGVSAADNKTHTVDWNTRHWGRRHGNEGRVGPPAAIFRVRRERPNRPEPPPDSERVYATPADYHGHSFYTYRWKPVDNLKAHIFRALDDTIFKRDWLIRTTRTALDPTLPRHKSYFPEKDPDPDETPWDLPRKQAAARALNIIASLDSYADLESNSDAQAVLARLPGNEGKVWGKGLEEWDWEIRTTRGSLNDNGTEYFPNEWCESEDEEIAETLRLKRETIATELNDMVLILKGTAATVSETVVILDGTPDLTPVRPYRDRLWLAADREARQDRPYRITAVDQTTHTVTLDGQPTLTGHTSAWAIYLDPYRDLSNDVLRILAGLPGNERAFSQITMQPLDPNDTAYANRPGPDNPDDFMTSGSPLASDALCAYVDTLAGRSTNRYFYRAAFVDGAQNCSYMSLSSPPVYLPNIVPPRAPVITKVFAGDPDRDVPRDNKITLQWVSNREPDLVKYQVYRAESKEISRDIRLMTPVHTEEVPSGEPMERPAVLQWTDDVPGLVTFYYRVVAVDEAGNESKPSFVVAGRAFDETPPTPPIPSVFWTDTMPIAEVRWTSEHESLLQRKIADVTGLWRAMTPWLPPGLQSYRDTDADASRSYEYRVWARKTTGAVAVGDPIALAAFR